MRKIILFTAIPVCLCVLAAWGVYLNQTGSAQKSMFSDSTQYEKDILPAILALNSETQFKPPQQFRPGHVSSAPELKKYLEQTAYGFCIQLPHQTLVPTPAIINGSLLVSGGFGSKEYYSFEATTGQLQWSISLDDDGPSSPAIQDGIIVFNTESCTIFACDLLTGKHIWSYWLGDPLMSMPTIANGIVFTAYPAYYQGKVGENKKQKETTESTGIFPTHVLAAFDLKTGRILWQKWIDSDIMSAPVAKNEVLYVTTFSGAIYKINQKNGDILEAKAVRATSAPVFDQKDELVISRRSDKAGDSIVSETLESLARSSSGNAYKKQAFYLDHKYQSNSKLKKEAEKMDAGNGFFSAPASANWKAAHGNIGQSNVASLQSFQGSRAIHNNGYLYITMGDEIVCTNPNGNVKWKYALDGDIKTEGGAIGTPPIYANGYIIAATLNGEVLMINAKDGKIEKKYIIKDAVRYQPIAEKGWIYVTTVNSKLYAINTGNPAITGWSMWGGNPARMNTPAVN